MTDAVAVQTIVTVGGIVMLLIQQRRQGKRISRIDDQTSNSHSETEFPNLRDEVTAIREDTRATRGIVHGLERRVGGVEAHLQDLGRHDDSIEDTIRRKEAAASRDLKAAVEERNAQIAELTRTIPIIVREAIGAHVGACPLRHPGDDIPTA
ncbi:hypothetical protein GCM10010401_07490 [Rarobacter faecitabidus]|uniref:Uncharacterized protein n=1 Tax=Rarobacter faecitabidus TaxID=13243 RepID=A0A542ZAI5_RARFA|nr:hypothetical protein [Rarobacter faecitabidus]TQL57358.1 hypothetical protein FB461_2090 [Rarobacter faecitabidus]